jgi:hypothetical protein
MAGRLLRRVLALLITATYFAAAFATAASPVAECPGLKPASHAGHSHHSNGNHHDRSGSKSGECLKCCLGACLVGVSLPAPTNGAWTLMLNTTSVAYWSGLPVLADRSIAPDPDPPKPIA